MSKSNLGIIERNIGIHAGAKLRLRENKKEMEIKEKLMIPGPFTLSLFYPLSLSFATNFIYANKNTSR